MDCIDKVFDRIDLQQIRCFFLCGVENSTAETLPYRDVLKKGRAAIYQRLEDTFTDQALYDEVVGELYDALGACEDVYMELGMKAGARLLYQLLLTDDPMLTKETKPE